MERIKQALDLARKEREKQGGSPQVLNAEAPIPRETRAAGESIEYTETRTVDVNVSDLRKRRILVDQQNAVADAYRILRTQILQRMRDNAWNTLAITSPKNGEGKSLSAINLAISLAREVDYTVLLVDANLRTPDIHNQLGIYPKLGLSDYLVNDVPLNELLVHPKGIAKFVVLPAGKPIANSSEMLSSPKMAQLVDELKSRYPSRIVLFDLPPVLTSSDAIAFLPKVDAALVVIEEGSTQKQDLRQAFEMLQGVEIIGTVLNKSYTSERDYGDVGLKDGIVSRFINYISKKYRSAHD
jgi:exopolysaccharide/PEP-CTERM locus tyrosine autokinase